MGYSFIYIKNGFFFTYKILYIIWDFLKNLRMYLVNIIILIIFLKNFIIDFLFYLF